MIGQVCDGKFHERHLRRSAIEDCSRRVAKRPSSAQRIRSDADGSLGDGGLNHKASRIGSYDRQTGVIDLGHEPPLSVDGSEAAVIDRRRVSVQWFSGTILTGLCGAALIGGAVFASLDGEMTFAKVPERSTLR